MDLKISKNINFRLFFYYFFQLLGCDTACLVTTQFLGHDTACLVATQFLGHDIACLVATQFLDSCLFFFSNLSGP